jgi:hypothetical protein
LSAKLGLAIFRIKKCEKRRRKMTQSTQNKPTLPTRIARFLQAVLASQLKRLHEHAAAVWSDDAPANVWAPRPDRLYRGVRTAFGQHR